MSIRCAHCKREEGKGSHDTVAQVKLCARRHGVGVQKVDEVKPLTSTLGVLNDAYVVPHDPRSASAAFALAERDQISWKEAFASREAEEERAAYQRMVDTDTV